MDRADAAVVLQTQNNRNGGVNAVRMRNDPDQLTVLTQIRQLFQSVLKRILVQCAETFIQKQCVYAGPVTRHARKTKIAANGNS